MLRFALSNSLGLLCASMMLNVSAFSPDELAAEIDRHINARCEPAQRTELVSESEFIRRVTLDLAGRIPTRTELQAFRDSESLTKRQDLVEQLIASPDFAFHHRNELDTLLLRRLEHNDAWRGYLLEATQANRSWDHLFRQIMIPEDGDDTRPATFLRKRLRDLDTTTNDSSVIWFGVNIGCAKCHDHPLVDDWTQGHYYGLASFFKRTYQTRAGSVGERFDGSIQFTTVDGDTLTSDFMFLTGKKLAEPKLDLDQEQLKEVAAAIKKVEREDKAPAAPRPDFRPRSELVEAALTETEQDFFARNIANRLWARMFGRGLIHPLDQGHSENPPSHPELLDLLARDLRKHDFDLRRTLHAMALTDTYARAPHGPEAPPDELFAGALPRPLSPHQYSLSLLIASSSDSKIEGLPAGTDWQSQRAELEKQSERVARQLEIPADGFQVSITETLWFSNHPQIQNDYLQPRKDRLVGDLMSLESDADVIVTATQSVLSRDPSIEESDAMAAYLEQRTDRRADAIGQIVWALFSSPEFRFNH